jgi:type IV pilus assembly protein PilQ
MNYNRMISSRVRDFFFVALIVSSFSIAACTSSMAKKGEPFPPTSPSAPVAPLKKITQITTTVSPDSTTVSIKGTDKLTYTSVKQPFPLAVALYFPETGIDRSGLNQATDSDVVSSIETSGPTPNSPASKINILLKRDASYEVLQQNAGLDVVFKKAVGIPATPKANEAGMPETDQTHRMMAVSDIQTKEDIASSGRSGSRSPAVSTEKPMVAASGKRGWVNKIDFVSEEAGKSTVLIGTSHPVEYNVEKVSDKRLNLNLLNANIPDYRQRQLITTRFESAVDRIIPVQTSKMRGNSIISIELRESVPYFVEQSENLISIHFEASSIAPRPLENAELPAWKNIISEAEAEPEMEADGAQKQESGTVHETDQYFQKKVYTGEKIALDFYETDIKNVFRILREISGKNFIIDDDVKGKVTMTLDKPVPWDQVLDLVLKMNQLGVVYEDDIIRIATLKTIEKESKSLMDSVTAEREAKDKIKDLAPVTTEYISISYSKAKAEILPHLQNIITKERGSITVDERNNQIIMTDTAEKIMQAKEIVKNIDKVTPQVIIEAKIVEISSKASKEIGVEWGASGGIQGTDANAGIGPQRGFDILGGTTGWNTAMNFPAATDSGIGFNFTRIAGTPFVLDARLSALESSGGAKIVSAPKVVTLDNKKAMIKQGVEVGYYDQPAGSGNTNQTFSVEWKDVDLQLEVTPHVTPDSRISMSMKITKNDISGYFNNIPAISTNEAETELLVNDGDTLVIGGIMKSNQSSSETGFPGLSKIPGLGWLFRDNLKSGEDSELLIFITPKIVQLEQRPM